ncbi:hypothetical protein OAP53_00230 [Alphaproteobacteria bacterium]|nr:hypothetical protein [Alphaproteobacteria bacterium]
MQIDSVFIRVSTAKQYGNGHFTRAIALLIHLKKNFHIQLITDNEISEAQKIIITGNNTTFITPQEFVKQKRGIAYGLIIDHYALDLEERRLLTSGSICTLQFDDHCILHGDVDISVLPTNPGSEGKNACTELVGLGYAVVDDRFIPTQVKSISDDIKCLINFGSFDGKNMTIKVLKDLAGSGFINKSLKVVCLVPEEKNGQIDAFKEKIQHREQIVYVNNIEKMWTFLPTFDISICSGGRSLLENLRVGLPSIVFETDSSQANIIRSLILKRAILFAGSHQYTSSSKLTLYLSKLLTDVNYRKSLATLSSETIDGKGAERLVNVFTQRFFSAKV